MDNLNQVHSGKLYKLNNEDVDYSAEVNFNEYYECNIIVYDANKEWHDKLKQTENNSAEIKLYSGEYISIFNFYIKEFTIHKNINEPEYKGTLMKVVSSNVIWGRKGFPADYTFSEMCMEITDGHELIGVCPYDLNSGCVDRSMYNNINIPVITEPVRVDTNLGIFHFDVTPQYYSERDRFSIGISHKITFQPLKPVMVKDFHDVLQKITDFFSLLSGEIVTINKLKLIEHSDSNIDVYEFVGYCNFPKKSLNVFNNGVKDSVSFKRVSVFKITDFTDVKKAMDYWFDNYDNVHNAHQAYGRIMFDEELKAVSINKFLAAIQMIEGYAQAFIDEEKEISEFNIMKENIIQQLKDESDKELVRNGLGLSGITFRNTTINYFLEAIEILFEKTSKNAFKEKYGDLIENIVNDRNYYTHSSRRTGARLSVDDALNVSALCKEIYRVLILTKMGMPVSVIHCRLGHNCIVAELFNRILGIEIKSEQEIPEFDRAMWEFGK